MTTRVIIDTDPGQDDALAILLALSAEADLDVAGITTVAGNVGVAQTCINALRICQLANRQDIPVVAGCAQPILRPLHTAEFICGADGLAGMELAAPRQAAHAGHAVTYLIDQIRGSDINTTICALGPLTNIALALLQAPDIKDKIDRLVIMGGARDLGNITAAAEFNFFVDPHAAAVVFNAGLPITLFPLSATYQAVATPARLAGFDADGTVGAPILSMLRRERPGGASLGGDGGHPMHDACVIAWLLWPDLFEGRDCHVAIETTEGPTVGRSTIDWWGRSGLTANAHVIGILDADAMFARIATSVRTLDAVPSPHAKAAS
ncbi:Inosine-uridine nucleoside N-ribohydrolase [Hoeflea sp. IMCC20628]|uniref:nucleoside hydrolase n=1 Tax=Hoeflea sp. IMCC20628 TaxID=1620421 RepID=UPI00063AF13A|nr:nucleoside hydrolase [Hoeflea sp. IMCC20628]AKI01857.1 Inosine-uridine nucleoside N-ribohydrolase [Hoeflea sp. IMCC20628]